MIYFVQAIDGGPIKIGYTADVPARVRQLEAHYGKPLAILATLEGDREKEADLRTKLAESQAHRDRYFEFHAKRHGRKFQRLLALDDDGQQRAG